MYFQTSLYGTHVRFTHSHVSPIYFSVLLETNLGKFVVGGFVVVCFCPCGATTVWTLMFDYSQTQRDFTGSIELARQKRSWKRNKKQTQCTVSASWISELNVNSSHFGKTVDWALLSAWFGTVLLVSLWNVTFFLWGNACWYEKYFRLVCISGKHFIELSYSKSSLEKMCTTKHDATHTGRDVFKNNPALT